jgi:hypothetical protein
MQPVDPRDEPKVFDVDLIVLDGGQEALAIQRATEFAQARGIASPKPNDQLFELGHMVHVLSMAIVDKDVIDSDEPFFESAEEILKAHELGTDGITYLYEAQRAWQTMVSPGRKVTQTAQEYIDVVMAIAEAKSADPFSQLGRVYQQSCLLFMATTLRDLMTLKLLSSSASEASGTSSSSAPESQAE